MRTRVQGGKMERVRTTIRWIARIWSIPSIVTLLLPYFMEGLYWLGATSIREVIGHICFFAVLVGLILAWRWEGLGGSLTVGGLAAFYVTWWLHGKHPRGPFFLLVAAPGFLFLLYWTASRFYNVSGLSNEFVFLVGFTLSFHIFMTIEVMKMRQPDIVKTGELFSVLLIYVINVIVLLAALSLIFKEISFIGFTKDIALFSKELYIEILALLFD